MMIIIIFGRFVSWGCGAHDHGSTWVQMPWSAWRNFAALDTPVPLGMISLSLSLSLSPDALGMISDLAFFFFMKYRKYLHLKILNGEYFSPDSFGKQTNSDEILVKSSLNSKNTLLW